MTNEIQRELLDIEHAKDSGIDRSRRDQLLAKSTLNAMTQSYK